MYTRTWLRVVYEQPIPWRIFRPLNKVGGKTCQNRTASQALHLQKRQSDESDDVQVRESVGKRVMKTEKRIRAGQDDKEQSDCGRQRGRRWSGRIKFGESMKVQAEREMNPVTLLGSRSICTPHNYIYIYIYGPCTGWSHLATRSHMGGKATRPHLSIQPAVW